MNIPSLPKRESKLIDGLSDFIFSCTDELLASKEDMLSRIEDDWSAFVFDQDFDRDDFMEVIKDFTDEKWKKLMDATNFKIGQVLKLEKREAAAMKKILDAIKADEFLSSHNISIHSVEHLHANHYEASVFLICGIYELRGRVGQIVGKIKDILKRENVKVKIYCPGCSSKNIRLYDDAYCMCHDCGSLSLPHENKVIKQYSEESRDCWWHLPMDELGETGEFCDGDFECDH